jgi:hypothetical protein
MLLSQPLVANRLTKGPGALADTSDPTGTAGAHDTAVTPMGCVPGSCGAASSGG